MGQMPLYRFEGKEPSPTRDGHLGLWFDKFFDGWRVAQTRDGQCYWTTQASRNVNPKSQWLEKFFVNRLEVGRKDLLQEAVDRLVRLVEAYSGRWGVFQTESRFVTGLGRTHPIENGFAWHPTLGVPYLPGSSIKGMVRAWTRTVGVDQERVTELFGPDGAEKRGVSKGQGSVVFLDAIPCSAPKLALDVMTPHYANWQVNDPPGDWRSPTPIVFLTTAPRTRFLFGIIPSRYNADAQLDQVMEWLKEALYWAGAGAKTAVGYGRMQPDPSADREVRRRMERIVGVSGAGSRQPR